MKRIPPAKARWLQATARRRLQAHARRRHRKLAPQRRAARRAAAMRAREAKFGWTVVAMPRCLQLLPYGEKPEQRRGWERWAQDTLGAIEQTKTLVRQAKRVKLDFSGTHRVTVEAMLLLQAEVDRLRVGLPAGAELSAIAPRSGRVAQVFTQVGFAQSVGLGSDVQPTRDDVIHWVPMSGAQLDAAELGARIERAAPPMVEAASAKDLYAGLTEAIVNSVEHAYIEDRGDGFRPHPTVKWWLLAQLRDDQLWVAVCDLGIGIPRSLPIKHGATTVGQLLGKLVSQFRSEHPDTRAIRAAFDVGQSRTGAAHRGHGLRDTLRVLAEHGKGSMLVMSNRGVYLRRSASDSAREESMSMPRSIGGTLTMWRLPLAA